MVTHVGYSVARQLRGRVAPCAVYIMHVEMRSTSFLIELQNHWDGFSSVCASKPMVMVSHRFVSGLDSKPLGRILIGLCLKIDGDGFSSVCQWFGLKTTGTVSHWFVTQNRWRRFVSGLTSKPLGRFSLVCPQNRW
jgi:hypothetical protein